MVHPMSTDIQLPGVEAGSSFGCDGSRGERIGFGTEPMDSMLCSVEGVGASFEALP